ncbi:MAG: o-succinylbenzoate synthase [Duncaniella sp.]|nr:o-succinylbenzoate synthase [Duncaniella sp.]
MMRARYASYRLDFNFLAQTSRESMRHKDTYFLCLAPDGDDDFSRAGWGEAGLFRGLSAEDGPDFLPTLHALCHAINHGEPLPDITSFSSLRMAMESARADMESGGRHEPFTSARLNIPINGLIWIDTFDATIHAIERKARQFEVIKIKVGRLSVDEEGEILRYIRRINPSAIIRLDANGAFHSLDEAMERIEGYARHRIHSIEQPVPQRRYELMSEVIRMSPIPVALDEELIGINSPAEKRDLLEALRPAYIILKPTLCGGFSGSKEWITAAGTTGAGWWFTSALESNVGLNAIARFTASLPGPKMCQGLGTGQIYSNNIPSPLDMQGQCLISRPDVGWQLPALDWIIP